MSEEVKVTIATPFDIHEIMDIALEACEENGLSNPNPAKLLQEVWSALHLKDGLVGIIRNDKNVIEGAILLRIGTMWYSDERILEEKAIFIHPDYRVGRVRRAPILCDFAKMTADRLGIPLIIGVLSNQRTEAKVRLYERQFGKPSGAYFIYGASTGLAKGH
jgi:hypothetical protein